ncbi:MAG: CoA protein activase [Nitrospirae bacterium]|nr:CoA protein activase [Nitrospirota bacterium]
MKKFIGLDAGSVSVKIAVLDAEGSILETKYVRHKGKPLTVACDLLSEINCPYSLSITGSAGRLIAQIFGIEPVNEIVAQSYSTKKLFPHINTVFEMGGEDSKLILLENGRVKEFSMNSVCAAGTGSFLDQQAERLRLSIEEFSEIALKSETPPRIAGRCSVFAKSDMIHLQQIATPMEDIVAGLCFAVARNFKGSICKNMALTEPVSFQGGVASNKGVTKAIKEVFGFKGLLIPEHYALMPAIGAALNDMEQGGGNTYDIEKLKAFLSSRKNEDRGHEPLTKVHSSQFTVYTKQTPTYQLSTVNRQLSTKAYLGIDIGSISTNLAVIDEDGGLLAKRYLMTAGRPIEAVRQGLAEIGGEIGNNVKIIGVGTTGSGRYMIADFVGADIVKNEITAQATAAVAIDTEVDTIFEIGGQDSKYISIKDGVIVDFEMNKACAAGTGSFIEEQAEKLDLSVKEEFSKMAFESRNPCALGERCTVFMENSLLSRQQRGIPKEDLVAGLSYSIVQNYINRVVGDKKIGEKIFFQGGVAFNEAVVAAFEKYLNKSITVPPHHDVTGAIGMAIIARGYMKNKKSAISSEQLAVSKNELTANSYSLTAESSFKGFDLSRRNYEIKSFGCKGCENLCEINSVRIEGEKDPLFYGSRCEKYDVKRKKKYSSNIDMPDLFAEREDILTKTHREYKERFSVPSSQFPVRIGIPRIFFFHDLLPFWSTLLWELGFEVELSDKTTRQIVNKGVENILSESCFPHKASHGHIKNLIEKNVDAILIPSFINLNSSIEAMRGFACPYVQTIPYIARAAFGKAENRIKFLNPVVNKELGEDFLLSELHKTLRHYNISKHKIKKAVIKAENVQGEFISAVKNRGKKVLGNLNGKTIVILGRSYNAFDSGMNLDIPKKLSDLGVLSIPMDYLPLEEIDISSKWPGMYWRSGQNILRAAEIIRNNTDLFALYLGNFSCGPDSFIHKYFKETIGSKPFLQIEIDEHSADAGVITRCEAFLDSISNIKAVSSEQLAVSKELTANCYPLSAKSPTISRNLQRRIIFIPRMSDHALGIAAAFESCGVDAEVLDAPDIETVKVGRQYISGKECYPCVITTGDMVKKAISKDFNPSRAAFFMPSGAGPCRFGQYNILHRLVLSEAGFPDVPIFSPNQDASFYRELGMVGKDLTKHAWKGIIAIELLMKCLHETRPYESNKGETENIYKEYLVKISRSVKSHNGAMHELLREMQRTFSAVPKNTRKKPLVGIVGEIFVRHNAFSNEDIIRKIEALGGEVWLAPVEEWLYYVNQMGLRKAVNKFRSMPFSKKAASETLSIFVTGLVQKRIEHEFSKPFNGFLKTVKEPSTKKIFANALPYLHNSFEGEAILSMGKAVDFVQRGASGIISVMPFGCMPGTIVSALLKGLKQDTDIPCLSIAYDGAEATCSEIQLEAFMHQAAVLLNGAKRR